MLCRPNKSQRAVGQVPYGPKRDPYLFVPWMDHQVHRKRVCGPGAGSAVPGVARQARLQWRFGVLPVRFPEI